LQFVYFIHQHLRDDIIQYTIKRRTEVKNTHTTLRVSLQCGRILRKHRRTLLRREWKFLETYL